jgi:hypothetical protein
MADEVFNIAKGRVVEYYNRVESNDPTNSAFTLVLLKVAQADTLLRDHEDLGALLAAANTEAAFTGYARIDLESAQLAPLPSPDHTNDRYEVDLPDQTWNPTSSETMVKLLVCYDSDTTSNPDSSIIPCTHHDFSVTTDSDFTAVFAALGFYRAAQ